MRHGIFLVLVLASTAFADVTKVKSESVIVSAKIAGTFGVMLDQTSASRLYAKLKGVVSAGVEDVNVENKTLPGIYCVQEKSSTNPSTLCELVVDETAGILSAAAAGTADVTIEIVGKPAMKIYNNLQVNEGMGEGSRASLTKSVLGLSCTLDLSSETYSCEVSVDSVRGVLAR